MLLSTLLSVLFLTHSISADSNGQSPLTTPTGAMTFNLAHHHGQAFRTAASLDPFDASDPSDEPLVMFSNPTGRSLQSTSSIIRTRPMKVRRPRSQKEFQAARFQSLRHSETVPLIWDEIEVPGPDVEDRLTLLELAKMTGNAYAEDRTKKNWYPIDEKWNTSTPFGWDVDDDGFRGHVFVSGDKSTVILSIKGTTLSGGGPTARKDKLNDNRLFSCCCGYVNWSWRMNTVCNCFSRGYKCRNECLREALMEDSVFYTAGINLYNNLTYMYPTANIWIVGHSLGGALSSLLGATFGAPVVAFESPGEKLAAKRLHLPVPLNAPPVESTFHVYHTADPIPSGSCTGMQSLCSHGGYAMETRCHLGQSIVYDTITKNGWRAGSLTKHPIKVIITEVLDKDWEDIHRGGRAVPEATHEEDCIECYKWEFIDGPGDGDEDAKACAK